MDWNDLLTDCKIDDAVIEYVDPREQNSNLIAMNIKNLCKQDSNNIYNYTHCEIHPSTLFGILASCIPFPET